MWLFWNNRKNVRNQMYGCAKKGWGFFREAIPITKHRVFRKVIVSPIQSINGKNIML